MTAVRPPSFATDDLVDAAPRDLDDGRRIVCALLRRFYAQGWVSGTGGGLCLVVGARTLFAPSGVHKELVRPEDLFVVDEDHHVVEGPPSDRGLCLSECVPLFRAAIELREAGCVVHTHSKAALLASLAFDERFESHDLEMHKGLRGFGASDPVVVPILENPPREAQLTRSLREAIEAHPRTHAVLVRGHGVYVWGEDWREAKRHAEVYDYLFDVVVRMRDLGLRPRPIYEVSPG